MKYMGSKRVMLQNGLGSILSKEAAKARRFVDLFAGSAAVSIHVATRYQVPVMAVDLQSYSAVLANAVLQRESAFDLEYCWPRWRLAALELAASKNPPSSKKETKKFVTEARCWCEEQSEDIIKAYGGHYFSPTQVVMLHSLLGCLPSEQPFGHMAHAAIINAASMCAASPGHTAQPFQPTRSAKKYIFEAWNRDVLTYVESSLKMLANQHSLVKGTAMTGDAINVAKTMLREGDLCFIDPPYSGVHYSRFYHVLESIAQRGCGEVDGVGRYPSDERRPKSDFSKRSAALGAMANLLQQVAKSGAAAIVTFPLHECSNGISGEDVKIEAAKHFQVEREVIHSKFSSLGGNSSPEHRSARIEAKELILKLRPK